MRKEWLIDTDGKPLQTVQHFIRDAWKDLAIEAMILPLKSEDNKTWDTEVIAAADQIDRANPFTPIMVENIAQQIPGFLQEHPSHKTAALLRPCEVRALFAIKEKTGVSLENLVIFCADCLGTFPASEFSWRADRKGTQESLAEETLQFSRQGGIASYRYRTACQLCTQQTAGKGDVNIHIVGLPVRHKIMISADEDIAGLVGTYPETLTGEDYALIEQHQAVAERMLYRNQQTNTRLSQAMVADTNLNLEILYEQLNDCGDCQVCMGVCPICTAFNFHRDQDGILSRELIAEWMIACVGCGMCEENCVRHRPLSAIFSVVREQLAKLDDES